LQPTTNNIVKTIMAERERKAYKWGQRTQKMMSFKVDLDLAARLAEVKNKGRLINNLLRDYFKVPEPAIDEDTDPGENDLEEYMK